MKSLTDSSPRCHDYLPLAVPAAGTVEAPALAELVAHPRRPSPFWIDADNRRAGTAGSVAEAAASGRVWACRVAPDVLVWDLDNDEHTRRGDDLADLLEHERWPYLRTTSGRAGHRHLWAVVPDADARRRFTAAAADLDLPAPREVMRPPLSPHRLGLPVEPLDDVTTFAADVEAVRAQATTTRLDWYDLLQTGRRPRGADQSGSAIVWLICIGAIRAGHGLSTVRAWLAVPENRGGHGYRRRLGLSGRKHADYWLEQYVWPSAEKRAAIVPPVDATEARERLDTIAGAVDAADMPGQGVGAQTDRAILRAIIARGRARGSLTPTMSYREIAEAACVSVRTVNTAIGRLVTAGWLQVARTGGGSTELAGDGTYTETLNATRWRIRVPDGLALTFTTQLGTPGGCTTRGESTRGTSSRAMDDVCRYGRGLGLSARRAIEALQAGPLTAAELADRLRMNARHVASRLLPRLEAHGIVSRSRDRWAVTDALDAALEAAAVALGLVGRAAEVVAAHIRDRDGYRLWREVTRPRRIATEQKRRARWLRAQRARGTTPLQLDSTPAAA